jgi:hypothetical protein
MADHGQPLVAVGRQFGQHRVQVPLGGAEIAEQAERAMMARRFVPGDSDHPQRFRIAVPLLPGLSAAVMIGDGQDAVTTLLVLVNRLLGTQSPVALGGVRVEICLVVIGRLPVNTFVRVQHQMLRLPPSSRGEQDHQGQTQTTRRSKVSQSKGAVRALRRKWLEIGFHGDSPRFRPTPEKRAGSNMDKVRRPFEAETNCLAFWLQASQARPRKHKPSAGKIPEAEVLAGGAGPRR